jgi:cytochrome c553
VGKCRSFATDPDGTPAPTFLANTTLESYVQGNAPNVSSSCIRCHGNATDTTSADSDFTFLLERAR